MTNGLISFRFFPGPLESRPGTWWMILNPRAQSSWYAQNGRGYSAVRRYGHQNSHAGPAIKNHIKINQLRNNLHLVDKHLSLYSFNKNCRNINRYFLTYLNKIGRKASRPRNNIKPKIDACYKVYNMI